MVAVVPSAEYEDERDGAETVLVLEGLDGFVETLLLRRFMGSSGSDSSS